MRQTIKKIILTGTILILGTYMVLNASQYHGDYIRSKVGSQVVFLVNRAGNSGGTGFAIKTPSGDVLTLTNAHVCGLADDSGRVYAKTEAGKTIPLRVIESYTKADLCLLSKVPGMSGLSLASSVRIGEELGLVGHPHLMPLTLTRGQLIGYGQVAVMVSEGPCEREEGMYQTIMSMFGPVCAEIARSGFTNIPALAGSSGSPTVNFWGHLTGVLYAGEEGVNWGLIVPLSAVEDFLSSY